MVSEGVIKETVVGLCEALSSLYDTPAHKSSDRSTTEEAMLWNKVKAYRSGDKNILRSAFRETKFVPAVVLHTRQPIEGSLWNALETVPSIPKAEVYIELGGSKLFKENDSRWLFTFLPTELLPLTPTANLGGISFIASELILEPQLIMNYREFLSMDVNIEAATVWMALEVQPYTSAWSYSANGNVLYREWCKYLKAHLATSSLSSQAASEQ